MKFKTWEKIYWAVISTLLIFMIIGYHTNTDPKIYSFEGKPLTVDQVYFGFGFWAFIAVVIWLIVRYFVNKDKKD